MPVSGGACCGAYCCRDSAEATTEVAAAGARREAHGAEAALAASEASAEVISAVAAAVQNGNVVALRQCVA